MRSLLVLIAAWFTMGMSACSSLVSKVLTEPKVTFHSVQVRDAAADGATAVIGLEVENPNGISLTVDQLDYTLELGGHQIAKAELSKVATVAAREKTRVEIPVPFKYAAVFTSIFDLVSKGTAAYRVTGSARIGLFRLPFDHIGEVKLRQ